MNKRIMTQWMLAASVMLAGIPFMMSCSTDDNIDLGELDKTIGIGSDKFTLPNSSSNESKLGELLTFDEGSVIDTLTKDSGDYKKGDYLFAKGDTIKWATPKVKEVKFSEDADKAKNWDFIVKITDDVVAAANAAKTSGVALPDSNIVLDEMNIKMFNFDGDGNDAVIELQKAECGTKVSLNLDFTAIKNCITKADFEITFPDFFAVTVVKGECTGFTSSETIEYKDGVLKLTDVLLAQKKKVVLQVDELVNFQQTPESDPEKNYLVVNKDEVLIKGYVKMKGVYNMQDIDINNISSGEKLVKTDIVFDGDIIITEATGRFDPEIDMEASTVDINDIPDYLDKERVKISIYNPSIKFSVVNNIDMKAFLSGQLTAIYGDGSKRRLVIESDDLFMEKGSVKSPVATTIVLCRYKPSTVIPGAKYITLNDPTETKANDTIIVKDINKILYRIPEKIEFKFDAQADTTNMTTIELYKEGTENNKSARGCGYVIKPEYRFTAPLELEPGSVIVYNDTIDDLNKDLVDNDIDFYEDDAHIFIEADIVNKSPLQLKLKNPTAVGVKKAGMKEAPVISSVKVLLTDAKGTKQESITVGSNDKIYLKVSGTLKELDGIVFEVEAQSVNKETLNASKHSVKIDNLKIHLNGHVTMNLDD